jgi:PAS domain S-box-containing protein
MQDIIDFLFGTNGMMPHGYCFLWKPSLLWLFVISNAITALSYFSIPLALGFFAYKRKDVSFKWVLPLFSAFILACGITHVLSVVTIWNPVYGLAAIAEALTAIVSILTAVLLWPLIPEALRIPGPSILLSANKKLADEILYHKETKAQLSQLNTELDRLVELRTQELQASEQRFRTIFQEAPLGIAVTDAVTGHFHDINQKFAEITGRSKQDLTSSDWMHITHPDDIQEAMNNISLLNTRMIPGIQLTKRYIRPDNSIIWVKLSSVFINTETPSQYHLQMIEDITETRLAAQKNQQLGNILEQSINEIYIINSKTLHFEYVNQGGINNSGFSLDELKNMTLLDTKPEFDFISFTDLISPLLNGVKDQILFETIRQRKNGTHYPVEVCLQIYRNDPCYFVAICLDISERKAHEEKISRLSNFYACLSKINHAIVQINNEKDLFSTVCTITANLQQVKLAWIGQPDVFSHLIVPVAVAGEFQDYLNNLVVSVDPDVPEGQGPTGIAYRENRIVTVNDFQTDSSTTPWHDNAERYFAWGATCAVPILRNQAPYAVLKVYSNETDFFDEDVLKLMAELSMDLSFSVDSYAHEAARRVAEEKFELSAKVFTQSGEAIVITDKDNHIISVNRAFTAVTGYEEPEVFGKDPKLLASGRQDQEFYRILWDTLLKNNFWQGELWNRHKDGTIYPEWSTISVVRDETGDIVHYIAIFTDITQHKALEQQLEHLAHYDS